MSQDAYRDFIPDECRFSHDFALYLHDCMAQIVVEGEQSGLFETAVTFRDPSHADDMTADPSTFVLDWLDKNGYSEELGEALLKSTFPALLSDMCHFVFEALSCARKGKLTVAYALLRKPLRENLHYLEWMLADPETMLSTFYRQASSQLAFSRLGSDRNRVIQTIQMAINRTVHSEVHDAQYIYDLRYNKRELVSYDIYCNQAMHLITTKPGLETEQMNFNFVFSGEDALRSQWGHLYTTLPQLLFYALDVCESLRMIAGKGIAPDLAVESLHRSAGYMLWADEVAGVLSPSVGATTRPRGIDFTCPACGAAIPGSADVFRDLYLDRRACCASCGESADLQQLARNA